MYVCVCLTVGSYGPSFFPKIYPPSESIWVYSFIGCLTCSSSPRDLCTAPQAWDAWQGRLEMSRTVTALW